MAGIPRFIDGLGPAKTIPTLDLGRLQQMTLSAEQGFVLSRVDGRTSLGEIIALVPFGREQTVALLQRLWLDGAIELPGVARPAPRLVPVEKVKPIALAEPSSPQLQSPAQSPSPSQSPPPPPSPAPPGVQLADEQVRRIDEFFGTLERRTAFELLEVTIAADDKAIKRAYFRLSKEFHPDRFFGKELGDYRPKLSKIFLAIKEAFDLLSDKERRAAYEESAGLK
jgi:DnaJ domain